MAAEPIQLTLIGRSGRTYTIGGLSADATAGVWNFNSYNNAAATDPSFWKAPEDCVIVDFAITTGTTCTGANLLINNESIPVQLRYANHLDTLNQRPSLRIPLKAGDLLSATTN